MDTATQEQHLVRRRWIITTVVLLLSLTPLFAPLLAPLRAADELIEVTRNDADGDQIVDTADVDDDNDGVPDLWEIEPNGDDRDSDRDGMPDRLDLDSDNDGILDWQESGAAGQIDISSLQSVGGRLSGPVGDNGYLDLFEFPVDTGRPAYDLANTDGDMDELADLIDLDSDNDGLSDLYEAGVSQARDNDRNGRIDAPPGSVGADGIADYLQQINDQTCCDVTGDGVDDVIPRNTDFTDLPDFQDLDSDNDGVNDLLEIGGTDTDNDGRVDGFSDQLVVDGMDDGLLVSPLRPSDVNGNGLADHLDAAVAGLPPSDGAANDLTAGPSGVPQQADVPGVTQVFRDEAELGVRTGLNASGCSIQSNSTDALLILLVVLGFSLLGWRFTVRRLRR